MLSLSAFLLYSTPSFWNILLPLLTMPHIYDEILFSCEKERNHVTCDMDGPWEHFAKWNKSNRERQILYDSPYMRNLKRPSSQKQSRVVLAWFWGGGEMRRRWSSVQASSYKMKASLGVQRLRLCTCTAGVTGSIPGQESSACHEEQPKREKHRWISSGDLMDNMVTRVKILYYTLEIC